MTILTCLRPTHRSNPVPNTQVANTLAIRRKHLMKAALMSTAEFTQNFHRTIAGLNRKQVFLPATNPGSPVRAKGLSRHHHQALLRRLVHHRSRTRAFLRPKQCGATHRYHSQIECKLLMALVAAIASCRVTTTSASNASRASRCFPAAFSTGVKSCLL